MSINLILGERGEDNTRAGHMIVGETFTLDDRTQLATYMDIPDHQIYICVENNNFGEEVPAGSLIKVVLLGGNFSGVTCNLYAFTRVKPVTLDFSQFQEKEDKHPLMSDEEVTEFLNLLHGSGNKAKRRMEKLK